MISKNQRALDLLRKFNIILDKATEEAVLSGMITVPEVLKEYGSECCDWVVIPKPSEEYTFEEREYFDKYITSFLEIGKERDVVIDYVNDETEITVQVKHKDLWWDLQRNIGCIENWYMEFYELKKLSEDLNDDE